MKHYSREVKREAVRLYLVEGKTQAQIIEELEIKHSRRLRQWLQEYRERGEEVFEKEKRKGVLGRRPKKENQGAYIARLEMENDLLKKFHAELRKLELGKRNIGSSTTKKNDTK